MKKMLNLVALLTLCVSVPAYTADLDQGKKLVEENCVRCHGTEVYTREDRRIDSLPGLQKQVRRCEQMLGLTWFDEDILNVTGHLNQQYYKFDVKP